MGVRLPGCLLAAGKNLSARYLWELARQLAPAIACPNLSGSWLRPVYLLEVVEGGYKPCHGLYRARWCPYLEDVFPITTEERYSKIQLDLQSIMALRTILKLCLEVPDELMILQGPDYADYQAGLTGLKTEIEDWASRQFNRRRNLAFVPGKGQATPLDLIRLALIKCPDVAASPQTAGLEFIGESELREDLRIDLSSVARLISNGEWKASTVLAGSIIEALLLWRLRSYSQQQLSNSISNLKVAGKITRAPKPTDLEDRPWGLHEYTEVAAELGAILDETATLIRLVRDFRNLIHPGASARTGQQCDRGTALAAQAGIEFLVRDLTK